MPLFCEACMGILINTDWPSPPTIPTVKNKTNRACSLTRTCISSLKHTLLQHSDKGKVKTELFTNRFFISHDREFHVSSLPYKPEFKVMPEGWDGTTRDPDEVHYEISMKAEERLYEEFVQRLNFNKMKVAGEVKKHPYSRRRPDEGWNFTVEKLGSRDKRGGGGGWKFVSLPDGSSRPLNDKEKIYVKRETPKRRKRMLPPFNY